MRISLAKVTFGFSPVALVLGAGALSPPAPATLWCSGVLTGAAREVDEPVGAADGRGAAGEGAAKSGT